MLSRMAVTWPAAVTAGGDAEPGEAATENLGARISERSREHGGLCELAGQDSREHTERDHQDYLANPCATPSSFRAPGRSPARSSSATSTVKSGVIALRIAARPEAMACCP